MKPVILFVLLWTTNRWASLPGSILYAATSLTLRIPFVGQLFRLVLLAPIYLSVIVKLFGLAIAAAGPLWGYYIYQRLVGEPNTTPEFAVILAASCIATFRGIDDILNFNLVSYESILSAASPFMNRLDRRVVPYLLGNWQLRRSQARASFVELHVPQFFDLLVNIGLIYFSLGRLGWLESGPTGTPTLVDSLKLAFSSIQVADKPERSCVGGSWDHIHFASNIIVLIWLVVFVSLASSIIDDGGAPVPELVSSNGDSSSEVAEQAEVKLNAPALISEFEELPASPNAQNDSSHPYDA